MNESAFETMNVTLLSLERRDSNSSSVMKSGIDDRFLGFWLVLGGKLDETKRKMMTIMGEASGGAFCLSGSLVWQSRGGEVIWGWD